MDWLNVRNVSPMPRRSYLVASHSVGPVMDIAWFEGPRPSGGLWWIMTNAEFSSSAITHFAHVDTPDA